MAEWIEIKSLASIILALGSPLAMAEWIEIAKLWKNGTTVPSPLAMAEWIEIIQEIASVNAQMVSASDGGVD